MKRKISIILAFTFILSLTFITFTSCTGSNNGSIDNSDSTTTDNNTTEAKKQVPVYMGMTVSSETNVVLSNSRIRKGIFALSSGTKKHPLPPKPGDHIGDTITSIGISAFTQCNISSITIPESVYSISMYSFNGCYNLKTIDIPSSVTRIADGTFNACESLENINLHNGITSIGDNAFCGCDSLTSITIPNNVTNIGDDAFKSCDNLANITTPSTISTIGTRAFYDCDNLTDIYYTGSEEDWTKINIAKQNDVLTKATIHYNHVIKE